MLEESDKWNLDVKSMLGPRKNFAAIALNAHKKIIVIGNG
jgi:hypothetical protein